MYELSRVRLHSVGPAGARYQDVLLDFSGVGEVVAAPRQDALFAAGVHAAQGLPRRPSPASVLFLENGGGKSVLIKLIFSVMLPGRRQVVGTTNTRVLEKFVGAKDIAHVVLEWQHTRTGERVVTGKVSEWRGHVVSPDPQNLVDSWYCFRPSAALHLESLPLTEDGRLLTMSAFHERLDAAHAAEPELELFRTRRHHEWTERLDLLGLDTELFRYQRAMNAGEGEAADAFSFTTDGAFVEFLLRAVLSEDEPKELAEVVATYADNLARRGDLVCERDFVAGALDLLRPLAQEESLAAASRKLAATARGDLEVFAGEVAARDALEHERLDGLAAHLGEVEEAEKLAEGDHRRRAAVLAELRRLAAGMRLEEATANRERVDAELAAARREARAWRETGTVLAQLNARRHAEDLRELVGGREQKAKPALAARNAAAAALARGLLALAEQARERADAAERRVAELGERALLAQRERDEATSEAANRRAEAHGLRERIGEVRAEVATAVRAGLLAEGGDVADVAEAAHRARAEAESAAAELDRREADLERLGEEASAARAELGQAESAAAAARDRQERAEEELATARRRTDALAAEPRLQELMGGADVAPETDAPVLLDRLREARAVAEREQTALRMAAAVDERALTALGSGGLLPPPEEVQEALDALEEAGITAWSGWRFLSTLPAARRERLLDRVPHLVSGVLLNDPAHAGRAREVLAERRLLPRAIVPVGDTDVVDRLDDLPGAAGVAFLVPPNPAMYDEEAADAERGEIGWRQEERQRRLSRLAEAIAADGALSWKIEAWRADHPPGSVAVLAERAQAARSERERADEAYEAARREAERAAEARAALRDRLRELRSAARAGGETARGLDALAASASKVPQWTDTVERSEEAAARAEERAEEAGARAARLRGQAAEEQRTADGHRRTAASARSDLADVPGASEVSPADPVPAEPIDALRAAYTSAAEAYAKVAVGGDLRAELAQAERAESAALAEVQQLDEEVRRRATELLDTPDGSDASARADALARAGRLVAALEREQAEAIGAVATRKAELEQLPRPAGPLDRVDRPRDLAHAEELIEAAAEETSVAARQWEELQRRRAEARHTLDAAGAAAEGFGLLAGTLAPFVPREHERVFDGDLDAARARYETLRSALDTADAAVGAAEQRVRAAADALAQYATDSRFERLSTPVRQQIVGVRRDALPTHAAEWADALRPRLRTLTDDLEQIDRHRSGIVTRLHGMVEGALRTVKSAQRVSRLPEGLGDWSGQEFLRIRFAEPEESVLVERLGEVVDEAAVGRTADGREVKRDGMSLLLRGVQVAVPKGFRVDMLKPDSVLRTERQRVSEIRDVFSGGQQLTAAIILYCTMAALRANNRGRLRDRHSGVLFLDNPIGRASAGYLLELQRAVARALGVQLIYTTGLFDAGALSEFPLIIRLRNDADLRAGRKYLSVDATIRNAVGDLGDPDGVARLSATRLFARPETTEDGDEGSGENTAAS
ncbi:hypothetical protein SAMN05421810_108158 [Amycolatopsis arida]|uniref:Chromosome segregation ATPase n=1 Tax=Amycolatopsis arida TaxID=587909 RepID=A0A1I5Z2K6_9PSEU|nr:hypothetical protein [Amycolatopsis arida]TDX90070.1 hypothetical protein CLV69_108158 [Amycolatopsis arida]SFQ50681.1 hypothetical protein SAMN05421810_108158 [Amycolatopsis arida]